MGGFGEAGPAPSAPTLAYKTYPKHTHVKPKKGQLGLNPKGWAASLPGGGGFGCPWSGQTLSYLIPVTYGEVPIPGKKRGPCGLGLVPVLTT